MFKVIKDCKFTHTVEVMVPVDGGFERQTFDCQFRVAPAEEMEKHDLGTREGSVGLLKLVVVGFGDDLVDMDEKPLPYSDALRDLLIADYPTRQGLSAAYLAAISKGRSGN